MNRIIGALLVVTYVSIATPQTGEAQIGGLIKKKVKEAIKPPEKPSEPVTAPAGPSPTAPSTGPYVGSDGLPRLNGDVLVISPETLARLMRGMDSELALIADFEKVLAKYPTTEQYEHCKTTALTSPEGQKITAAMMNLPENVTPDQLQAVIMKMNTDAEALQKKKCPLNPYDWNDSRRSERMRQIHEKAASMARGKPAASASLKRETGQPDVNPFEAVSDSVRDTVLVLGTGGLTDREYSLLVERVVKYCELFKSMNMSPKAGGVRAPGEGDQIYWVFTEEELSAMKTMSCADFAKKYAKLIARRP